MQPVISNEKGACLFNKMSRRNEFLYQKVPVFYTGEFHQIGHRTTCT